MPSDPNRPQDEPPRGASAPRRRESVGRDPRFSRAFLASFGACAVPLVLGTVLGFRGTSGTDWASRLLVASGLFGVALLVIGGVVAAAGHRQVGLGMLLGVLAAAVVGFALCSGLLITS